MGIQGSSREMAMSLSRHTIQCFWVGQKEVVSVPRTAPSEAPSLEQRRALVADWLICLANLIPDQMTKPLNSGNIAI